MPYNFNTVQANAAQVNAVQINVLQFQRRSGQRRKANATRMTETTIHTVGGEREIKMKRLCSVPEIKVSVRRAMYVPLLLIVRLTGSRPFWNNNAMASQQPFA